MNKSPIVFPYNTIRFTCNYVIIIIRKCNCYYRMFSILYLRIILSFIKLFRYQIIKYNYTLIYIINKLPYYNHKLKILNSLKLHNNVQLTYFYILQIMFYHISQTLNVFRIFFLEDLSDSFALHPFLLTLNYKIKNN